MIAPCKDCPNKGCGSYHSKCKKYLEFREYKKAENEKKNDFYRITYKNYTRF